MSGGVVGSEAFIFSSRKADAWLVEQNRGLGVEDFRERVVFLEWKFAPGFLGDALGAPAGHAIEDHMRVKAAGTDQRGINLSMRAVDRADDLEF
jgi:hypothetical protein